MTTPSAPQRDSNFALAVILGILAREKGLNSDNITIVTNATLRGRTCKRYTQDRIEKILIIFGKEFVTLMDNQDVKGVYQELTNVLSFLSDIQTKEFSVPIIRVKDSDFDWEYVVRARHVSGIIITKVSAFPHIMDMKQAIHEEAAMILEDLARERK